LEDKIEFLGVKKMHGDRKRNLQMIYGHNSAKLAQPCILIKSPMDKSIYKLIFNFYFKIILVYVLVMNL
jgi:hypothetical protein